jgi:regulator of protease activity HflC (stomatin/prohibitin superfamily)
LVIGVPLLIFIFSGFYTVAQQTEAVVERFGKFKRVAGAGSALQGARSSIR